MNLNKLKNVIQIAIGNKPKIEMHTKNGLISYYDWMGSADADTEWFSRFIYQHFPAQTEKVNFYGVYGKGRFVHNKINGKKIFFSIENLDKKFTKWNFVFGDYCLPYVDLAMGFADIPNEKYLRFPLWIQYLFPPEVDFCKIQETIQNINSLHYKKTKECALLASHDKHGTRALIADGVQDLLKIDFAGVWRNNTRDLWDLYANKKLPYLRNFKFNICPENINTNLYVTEKIFEAFVADAIPIYYGSDNQPELGIINPAAVIFWNPKSDNAKARDLIIKLKTDELFYQDFIAQPKLLPGTAEYVYDRYKKLESKIKNLLV